MVLIHFGIDILGCLFNIINSLNLCQLPTFIIKLSIIIVTLSLSRFSLDNNNHAKHNLIKLNVIINEGNWYKLEWMF